MWKALWKRLCGFILIVIGYIGVYWAAGREFGRFRQISFTVCLCVTLFGIVLADGFL